MERRLDHRIPLGTRATLCGKGRAVAGEVRDISGGGARVEVPVNPRFKEAFDLLVPGVTVVFDVYGLDVSTIFARVRRKTTSDGHVTLALVFDGLDEEVYWNLMRLCASEI